MSDATETIREQLVTRIGKLPDAMLGKAQKLLTALEQQSGESSLSWECGNLLPLSLECGDLSPLSLECGDLSPLSLECGDLSPLSLLSLAPEPDFPPSKDWPHAPIHRLSELGTYIVTAATLDKQHFFREPQRLDCLERMLLSHATKYGWHLEAWAIFSNHYHFVAHSLQDPANLTFFLKELHAQTARDVNGRDGTRGRTVWYNFWDTRLTFEKSYFARLSYVHQNAVKHRLVAAANQYRWCSAAWFERAASPAQVKTIYSFKTDRVRVHDDFEPVAVAGR